MSNTRAEDVAVLDNEQLSRQEFARLGLKKVNDIVRVAIRCNDNQILIIESPDVYKSNGGQYIVFGDIRVDNFTQKLALAQNQARQSVELNMFDELDPKHVVNEDDLQTIMRETEVTYDVAKDTLIRYHGDIVRAMASIILNSDL